MVKIYKDLTTMSSYFKAKNILITGGCGFVGSHLAEELIKLRAHVVIIDQVINPFSYFTLRGLHKKILLIQDDVGNFERLFDIATKFNIEYIFHLAAQSIVETAYYNPKQTLYSNIVGTINVLETARQYPKIKAVVIASSDKAYGKLNKKSYFETDPLAGDHPYEVSKSCADLISNSYYQTYKVPVAITRFANIYGEGDLNFSRIIPCIMKAIITENNNLEIRSNGKFIREYVYIKDVVNGYLLLAKYIQKVKGQAFNFGSKQVLSVFDIIKIIEEALKLKINYKILNKTKNEIPYQALNFDKVKERVNWKPKYILASTLKDIFHWYTNYYEMQSL